VSQLLLLLTLLAALLAGGFLSRLLPRLGIRGPQRLLNWVLYLLIFTMGYRVGRSAEVTARLGEVGALALLHAAACVVGTLAVLSAVLQVARRSRRGVLGPPPAAAGTSASTLRPFREPLVLLAILAVGGFAGRLLAGRVSFSGEGFSTAVLYGLLLMVGFVFARSGVSLRTALTDPLVLLVPVGTAAGSLLGGATVALLPSLGLAHALALSSGFGWYSLSGLILTRVASPFLGSVALLSNMFRESLAIVLIPLLARTRFAYAGVGVAGATSMDVTLPVLERFCGAAVVPIALASGAVLSMLVPVLVPFFAAMVG
jgi:uncharacterized membrane protein YbjE (DUF340 family)